MSKALPVTRPDRSALIAEFLVHAGWQGAHRQLIAADASFRHYERISQGNRIAVLMDAPPPWEDVSRFLAITEILARCNVSVPEILDRNIADGLLLIEDFGDHSFTRLLRAEPHREPELYLAATDALVAMHRASSEIAPVLNPYNDEVYLREVALFSDWFLPQVYGAEAAATLRESYLNIWRSILAKANLKQSVIVHRDYHADNLFWLDGRAGHQAVGMIDYQDALLGDPGYDLASLLEDARRDVADTTVAECFARYVTAIGEPAQQFTARYCALAAQRNAKIIGIFTRLCVRDGKPHYLDYLPRVWKHFMGDLEHPLLKPLKEFIINHVPTEWRGRFTARCEIGSIES